MVVDLIPKLAHWVHKEMQNKNHAKHISLFIVICSS